MPRHRMDPRVKPGVTVGASGELEINNKPR